MRHVAFFATAIIAGLLSLPAFAQQTLPRPPSQMPPPGAQQKQQQQQQQGQKGAPPPQQQQQAQVAPPAPYTALKVGPPKPYNDPSLAALRKELAAIAQRKDRAALAKHVTVQGFF